MSQSKAYIFSTDPLDSANGKWDYGLLKEAFDRNHVEEIVVTSIPKDDRAFVVIPGQGNAGNEETINKELSNLSRVVLFITGDEQGLFNADAIKHPNISIWIQYPHQKHEKYNKFFIGAPRHIKEQKPDYPNKTYDVYFGGQITHQRRQELASVMPRMKNALYCPTEGFAQGDPPKEYYHKLASAKVAPAPSGAQVIDSFRFFEALEMLTLPVGDRKDSQGREMNFYEYIYGKTIPIQMTHDWNQLPNIMIEIMNDYPTNMHKAVCWWLKYKRDFAFKIMEHLNAH
jgi:hypothetical protein